MINKTSLKAAVKRHAHLIAEGKTPDEIIEALRADDKEFDEEGVQQIYEALISDEEGGTKGGEKKGSGTKSKFIVIKPFRDINDFKKEYKEGHDVSHFNSGRLSKLIEIGHVVEKANDK